MSYNLIWYIHKKSSEGVKSLGPYSLQDINEQIQQGILLGSDLIFKEGSSEWKPAYDWPEFSTALFSKERVSFTNLFKIPIESNTDSKSSVKEKSAKFDIGWVVLKKTEEPDGLKFSQSGPHTTDEVRELLQTKNIQPSDHIWRKGYKSWATIFSEPDFSPSLWKVRQHQVDLLKSVVETESNLKMTLSLPDSDEIAKKLQVPDAVELTQEPGIVSTISAGSTVSTVSKNIEDGKKAPSKPNKPELSIQNNVDQPKAIIQEKNKGRFAKTGFAVLSGVVACAFVVFLGNKYLNSLSNQTVTDSSVVSDATKKSQETETVNSQAENGNSEESIEDQDDAGSEVSVEKPSKNLKAENAVDKEIRQNKQIEKENIKPINKQVQPGLWSYSVADVQSRYTVLINGVAGQILQLPALSLKISLRPNSSKQIQINPSALALPQGMYTVYVFFGKKLLYQENKKLITDNSTFSAKLAQHRKKQAYTQQLERRKLVTTADSLQSFIQKNKKFIASNKISTSVKKGLIRTLDRLYASELDLVKEDRHQLVYASSWYGLANQYDDLKSFVNQAGARRPASIQDLDQNKKKIQQIRAQTLQMSLF